MGDEEDEGEREREEEKKCSICRKDIMPPVTCCENDHQFHLKMALEVISKY